MRTSSRASAWVMGGVVLMAGCESIVQPPSSLDRVALPEVVVASTDTWPGVFDPFTVLSLHIVMSNSDWDTIRRDQTNSIEVLAQFHAEGEAPIAVTVRRKSSRALPSESNPIKIGMKVKTVSGTWHGVSTLSLENGGDTGPVAEGMAWNLHELASVDGFYGAGYHPALASWVRVYINGAYIGVYVNVEQRNKQFLRNRFITSSGKWLYEVDEANLWELEAGDPHSPTWNALCFAPFNQSIYSGRKASGGCPAPNDAQLPAVLNSYIDMPAMLTQAAIDAFMDNNDALFSHSKNYSFVDFNDGAKRRYFPWDLDAIFRSTTAGIYGSISGKNKIVQHPYELAILNHATFRQQYNATILGLIDPPGPLSEANLHGFLDAAKIAVQPSLDSDPYVGAFRSGEFDRLKTWISARIPNVRAQVQANTPPPRP
ncbi:MAG TPA: CotH kinase family protein [Gemmatimonadaceae bacterium]|nr:CotH kinase family protein [Gemmatimonadaceae bacterium]